MDQRAAFLEAALWHGSLDAAAAILAAHPDIAGSDIHTVAVLGDEAAVRRFLAQDPGNATAKSAPYGGDALNHLCLSKYLRLDPTRSDGFLGAATALLDAGADPNTGFWTTGQHPERETALYGAAGVAHHAALTRLLLEHGADPNYQRQRGWLALHHAIARDNNLNIIELLLDHGADPRLRKDGASAVARAARRGRGDVLALFERRGIPIELRGVDRLIAACARNDPAAIRAIADREPDLVREIIARGGQLLAEFAGTWNTDGVRHLLDLGVSATALYEGDGYFDIAQDSTALHVAAWKGLPATVQLLIARGAPVDAKDGKGRTALALAVKACVDSYWTERRTPASVAALLDAGASPSGALYPSGYAEVDALLAARGASAS